MVKYSHNIIVELGMNLMQVKMSGKAKIIEGQSKWKKVTK